MKFKLVLAFESSNVVLVVAVPVVVVLRLFVPICIKPVRLTSAIAPVTAASAANATRQARVGGTASDMNSVEREHILKVLAQVGGSRSKAVQILGISERALRYKLKSYKEAGFEVDK